MKYIDLIEGTLLFPEPGDIILAHKIQWKVLSVDFDSVNGLEYYCSTWMVQGPKDREQHIRQISVKKILEKGK